MNILVIGSGGREHALAWKAAQSTGVNTVFVAPGNAGTASEPKLKNVDIGVGEFKKLADFVQANQVELTIVGPEAPLCDGIVDYFSSKNLRCFGPSKAAAKLEGSKAFSKDFLARHNIPTPAYANFTEVEPAVAYVQQQGVPIVIKADGLAAGKGVIIANTFEEANDTISDMLSGNAFGDAGCRVVIEEFLEGEEASFIVIADGTHVLPMATSQDHKRVGDQDTGPNTGGMGAYSPAPVVSDEAHHRIMSEIIMPTIKGMKSEGNEYVGFLYAGLFITPNNEIKVIEFNCRFGDPETQPIMIRLQSDLVAHCQAAIDGNLNSQQTVWDKRPAMGVVLAAGGYPNSYTKGHVIAGLDQPSTEGSKVFHAGTAMQGEQVITSGGRVLCATSLGEDIKAAQTNAYNLAKTLRWKDSFMRSDIGYRAIDRKA